MITAIEARKISNPSPEISDILNRIDQAIQQRATLLLDDAYFDYGFFQVKKKFDMFEELNRNPEWIIKIIKHLQGLGFTASIELDDVDHLVVRW